MKRILSLLMVFIIIISLCACSYKGLNKEDVFESNVIQNNVKTSSNEELIGMWVLSEGTTDVDTITFYSDGTCLVDNDENGTWSIIDNTLKVLGPYGGQFWDHDNIIGEYNLSSTTLIFTNPVVDGGKIDGQIIYRKNN